ncbi:hypothetical protein Pcinc_014710 [Petrolisthes cinctipes]|uniref:SWIM-type domain-containing protein n=1 Tax=Petrolisthes cinctipes TaxID=88211 RepID=A0AAE1KR53_PETCI|nr:hypothetical protein Pcinc_014710 [Petrolisthes cinctipes]
MTGGLGCGGGGGGMWGGLGRGGGGGGMCVGVWSGWEVEEEEEKKEYIGMSRSLEAYKYFIAGWVSELLIADIKQGNGSTSCIITAKVRHSQSLNEEALRPWFAMEKEGPIIAAHCSCVAGLGEACSHVAATMFAVESGANWTKKESCTSQPCGWVLPSCSSFKSAPLAKIDFTSPATKYKNFDKQELHPSSCATPRTKKQLVSMEARQKFLETLKNSGIKSASLSLIPGCNENFIPEGSFLPKPLSTLFSKDHTSLTRTDILQVAWQVYNTTCISQQQVDLIEKSSRKQTKSRIWWQQRAGRVTASMLKKVLHTSPTNPAPSLIRAVCYPQDVMFKTPATRWGCEHEKDAVKAYIQDQKHHTQLTIAEGSFTVDLQNPFFGASTDVRVQCSCCNHRVILEKEAWCYCRKGEEGDMVLCSNKEFKVRLFHHKCTRLTKVPKRKWLCKICSAKKRSLI